MNCSDNCCFFERDQQKCDTVIFTKSLTSGVSLLSCSLVLVWILWKRKFFEEYHHLIFFLNVSTIFDCVGYIAAGYIDEYYPCVCQAWWISFFDRCVIAWTLAMVTRPLANCVRGQNPSYFFTHGFCWMVPLSLSMLPFIGTQYGYFGLWWWYIPLFTFCVIMIGVSVWLHYQDQEEERIAYIRAVMPFPIIYILIHILPFVLEIMYRSQAISIYPLWIIACVTFPLHGFFNMMIYAINYYHGPHIGTRSPLRISSDTTLLIKSTQEQDYQAISNTKPTSATEI